jgi:hypothetical protein
VVRIVGSYLGLVGAFDVDLCCRVNFRAWRCAS